MSNQRESLDELLEGWASDYSGSVPSDLAQRIRRTMAWRKRRQQFAVGVVGVMLMVVIWNIGEWATLGPTKVSDLVRREVEPSDTDKLDLKAIENRMLNARLAELEIQLEIDQWKLEQQRQRFEAVRFEVTRSRACEDVARDWLKSQVASR